MKLTFFLIAFFLVFLRVYFSWAGHYSNRSDAGNLLVKGNNYIEEINWSGKISLSDDERSIAGISPGGYIRFRENDRRLSAESNLQGEIHYELYDGHENLDGNDSSRNFIAAILQQMIARGFYAAGRPERIYKRGGNKALLAELSNLQMENTRGPYLDMLFRTSGGSDGGSVSGSNGRSGSRSNGDSLTKDEFIAVIRQLDEGGNDAEKQKYLERVPPVWLKDTTIAIAWLGAVGRIGPDFMKSNLLDRFMDQELFSGRANTGNLADTVLAITDHMHGEMEKEKILATLIGKDSSAVLSDKLLPVISHMNGDQHRENLYMKLIDQTGQRAGSGTGQPGGAGIGQRNGQGVGQRDGDEAGQGEKIWIGLLNEVTRIGSDFEKSKLLVQIGQKMPKTENIKVAYRKAARTITNDTDYGRAMRGLD